MGTDWIQGLLVKDLKEELRKRDLPVSGKKAELQERLTEAVSQQAASTAAQSELDPENEPGKPAQPATEQQNGAIETSPAREPEEHAAVQTAQGGDAEAPKSHEGAPGVQTPAATVATQLPEGSEAQTETGPSSVVEKDDSANNVALLASEGAQENTLPPAAPSEGHLQLGGADLLSAVQVLDGRIEPASDPGINESRLLAAPKEDEPMEEPLEKDIPSAQEDEPQAVPVEDQRPPAVEENRLRADTEMADPDKPQDNLAAMQAALLEPELKTDGQPETGEEEELVDFDADEVMEESVKPETKETTTDIQQLAGEEPARVSTRLAEKAIPEKSPTPEPKLAVGEETIGKRKRQPIPSFKSLEKKASTARPAPAPKELTEDNSTPDGRKSVFARVGGLGEESARGIGAPPSRVQATTALLVAGFVRPFTVKAAQVLFETHGKVVKFWMPTIRDKAYVVFETIEAAESARQAVHGLEWPAGSRTSLRPKFVAEEEAIQVIEGKDISSRGSGLANKSSGLATAVAAAAEQATRNSSAEKRRAEKVPAASQPDTKKVKAEPVKEETAEEKLVTLEDLFRKTETKPHLYWLPVSDDNIAAKQQLRASQGPAKPDVKAEQTADRKTPTESRTRNDARDARMKDDRHKDEKYRAQFM